MLGLKAKRMKVLLAAGLTLGLLGWMGSRKMRFFDDKGAAKLPYKLFEIYPGLEPGTWWSTHDRFGQVMLVKLKVEGNRLHLDAHGVRPDRLTGAPDVKGETKDGRIVVHEYNLLYTIDTKTWKKRGEIGGPYEHLIHEIYWVDEDSGDIHLQATDNSDMFEPDRLTRDHTYLKIVRDSAVLWERKIQDGTKYLVDGRTFITLPDTNAAPPIPWRATDFQGNPVHSSLRDMLEAFGDSIVTGPARSLPGGMTAVVQGRVKEGADYSREWIFIISPSDEGRWALNPITVKGYDFKANELNDMKVSPDGHYVLGEGLIRVEDKIHEMICFGAVPPPGKRLNLNMIQVGAFQRGRHQAHYYQWSSDSKSFLILERQDRLHHFRVEDLLQKLEGRSGSKKK